MEKLTKALMTDETGQAIVTKLTALSGQMHELAMATRGSAILFESESDISVLGDGGYLAVYVGCTNPLVISGWTGDNSLVTGHLYYLIKSGTAVTSKDLGEYGGSAVTDSTLSIEGAPADAKAVGDALADKADADDVDAIDDRVTALEAGEGGGNPFDLPTATNLITILRKCVFSEDMSINIENLAEALGVNSGGGDDDDMTFRYGQSIPKGNTSRTLELTGMTIALTEIRLVLALHSDFAPGGFCWVQAPNAGTPYVGVDANGDFYWSNSSAYSGSFSATPSDLSDFVNTIKEVKIMWLNPSRYESRKYLLGFKFFFNNYNPSCGYTLYRCSGFNGSTEVFRLESSGTNGELYDVLTGTTYTFNNTTGMEIVEVSE